jgi:regulatory protein
MTEQEILTKLTALCAHAEHCSYEMRQKMRKWGVEPSIEEKVLAYLVKEKYIDDSRYARLFVKDRIQSNKWGRRKVEQALFLKQIPKDIIRHTLDAVEDEVYLAILRPLLKSKRRSIKANSEYEANGKLIRFAMGRGFTIDLIRQCLGGADDYDTSSDGYED